MDNGFTALILGVFALSAIGVASGMYQVRPVLSGSMEPNLPVGGVVVTQRVPVDDLAVGNVIVFVEPDTAGDVLVHRIASLTPGESGPVVQTKGDANGDVDPWTVKLRGDDAYRAVFGVPLLGYLAVWAHNPAGGHWLVVVGIALTMASLVGGVAYWRVSGRRAGRSVGRSTVGGPLAGQP